MSLKKLGRMIKKMRKEKNMSLRDLAKKTTVSFVNISHIENGHVKTSKKVLTDIATALDYDVDKMLAAGNEIGDDLEDIIKKGKEVVPAFLRTAKNLTAEDWKKLTKQVQKMNREKDNE